MSAGQHVFSEIDLVRAYNQISMAPEDIPKRPVITPSGLFEFLRMPFGLSNAVQSFQRFMDRVCPGLEAVHVYLDDIIVASANQKEHLAHLRTLFDRLAQHDATVNPAKCSFEQNQMDFLGHHISPTKIEPRAENVQTILDYPKPTSYKQMAKSSWNFDDPFLCQLTHDWKDFMEELVSPSRARWTHGVINSVEDMEAVISSAVNHLIPCELSVRQNGGCIRAYHFLRSTLAHDSQSECKEKTGSSMQRIFETSVFDQVFAKLNTLISVYNLEGKKDDHLKLVTLSHAFGLISDLLGHSTADSTVKILQYLSNKWGNLGEIVKDTVKSLIFERGGMATNAQEVVIYEILRLWRCALKAQVKIDRTSQFSKITTPYSSAIDTLWACLSTYPREWTSEVRNGSAEIMLSPVIAQLFYRTLKTVYKLVTANDWLGFLRTRVDDLVFDVVTAPVDQNKKEEGEVDVNPLILSLGRYAAKKDSKHDSDCDPLQPDHGLSLRLVLILALRLVASLDPFDPRALRLLRAVHTIVQVSQPHITPLVQGSQYEAAVVSLLSADDAHLFAGLDLWITIENKFVRMQGRELAEFIPNTDWLFAQFVSSIGFAPYLLVDWLVSPETSCLTYLVHYLRRFRTREDKRHFSATSGDEPSESHSETCAVDKHGVPSFPPFDQSEWPTEPIRSMLIQVSRCLSTLEANRNIAFSPLPLIRSINYVVSILPNRSVPIGQGVKC